MSLKYCAPFLDIFSYNIPSKRYHCSMTDNIIIIYCHVSCSSSDIYQNYSGFFFVIGKNGIGRSQRFKYHIFHGQIYLSDTFFNVFCSGDLSDDYMEISFQPSSAHADRTFNTCLIVNNEILRDNMNYLLADVDMNLMHILNQSEDFFLFNFIIICIPYYIAAVFHTFNMLTCYTDKDL